MQDFSERTEYLSSSSFRRGNWIANHGQKPEGYNYRNHKKITMISVKISVFQISLRQNIFLNYKKADKGDSGIL